LAQGHEVDASEQQSPYHNQYNDEKYFTQYSNYVENAMSPPAEPQPAASAKSASPEQVSNNEKSRRYISSMQQVEDDMASNTFQLPMTSYQARQLSML